jgi:hypothetical protein
MRLKRARTNLDQSEEEKKSESEMQNSISSCSNFGSEQRLDVSQTMSEAIKRKLNSPLTFRRSEKSKRNRSLVTMKVIEAS